ncbi:hypothetical protein EYY93_02845 [Hafnia paralvei]|nr:hypothetical protein EYY93_02845 [Hafnia paralvei]
MIQPFVMKWTTLILKLAIMIKKNILQAYKKHLSFEKDSVRNDFIPNIKIGKNQQVKNQGNTISVKYTWKGDRHLSALQEYEGGETETLFDYDGKIPR